MLGDKKQESVVIANINNAKRLYDFQAEKVKDEEYIRDLLLEECVRTIKRNCTWYDVGNDIIHKAQSEHNSSEKGKKDNLEFLIRRIKLDFLNNDENFNLKGIVSCGYGTYGWSLYFTGCGQNFEIFVPIPHNVDIVNIVSAHWGQFAFLIERNSGVWHTLKESYKTEDIAEFIREYFGLEKVEEKA